MFAEVLAPGEGTQFPLSRVLREKALAALLTCEVDKVIPYSFLDTALGLSIQENHRARTAVVRAGRDLLRKYSLKIINIRDVGYRIVRRDERVKVSTHEQKKSRRWLKRALETVTYVALDGLPPEEVAKIMTEQARCAITLQFNRRMRKQKVLPPKADIKMPKGVDMIRWFEKKQIEGSQQG